MFVLLFPHNLKQTNGTNKGFFLGVFYYLLVFVGCWLFVFVGWLPSPPPHNLGQTKVVWNLILFGWLVFFVGWLVDEKCML